jgi:glycerate kinase
MTAARSRLVPGFGLVAAWLELDAKIAAADIVITGEGRFDASSLAGKGPGEIVRRARAAGRRIVVFAGALDGEAVDPHVTAVAITPAGMPLPEALAAADRNLAAAVAHCQL